MQLKINLPKNLTTASLIKQRGIPCICALRGNAFEILFIKPLPSISGSVTGWNLRDIQDRVPAGGGGAYLYYSHGMITLTPRGESVYDIEDLSLFFSDLGWLPLVENGRLSAPGQFWDQE